MVISSVHRAAQHFRLTKKPFGHAICVVCLITCVVEHIICVFGHTICLVGLTICVVGHTICVFGHTICVVGLTICVVAHTILCMCFWKQYMSVVGRDPNYSM